MTPESANPAAALTRFSLRRRITVLVWLLTLLVVGWIAALGLPLELFPRGYEGQSLQVNVPWGNAPTEVVLERITLPLEEELSTVRRLDGLNSWSAPGGSSVFLRFKPGTDMDVAYREVRDRIERARRFFPEDVERTFIRKEDASGIPVWVLGLAIAPGLTDYYDLIQKEVVQPLSRVDGVAAVRTNGLEEKEIVIEVNQELAEGHGLNLYEMGQDLGQDNFTLASGRIREGQKEYLLRSIATYQNLEELENRPLTPEVRLNQVAQIRYEEPEKKYRVRVNGRPAVAVIVLKEGEANTVEVSNELEAALDKIRRNPRLQDFQMESLFNQGAVVEDSIANLVTGGELGGLLAGLVLFFFLRRVRLTGLITLSIPLSMLMALIVLFFAGETLNILTILGLVICVGLLVDNSVVVAENIHRYHQMGQSRYDACVRGAGEIALAITMATLTTVMVFLPVALVEGSGQFFLLRLALPVSVSLLASLGVALVFIPLSVYLTLPRRDRERNPSRFVRAHQQVNGILDRLYHRTLEPVNRGYNRALEFFLGHRLELILGLAAVFALTQGVAFQSIQFVPNQEEDQAGFVISVETANEYGFEEIVDYFEQVDRMLAKKKETYGLKGYFTFCQPRGGRIEGWLDPESQTDQTAKHIAEKLLDDLPKQPGIKLYYGRQNRIEEENKRDVYVLHLEGDDSVELEAVAGELETLLLGVEGVLGLRQDNEPPPGEMALVVDRERAAASQVNPQLIAGVIGYALRGQSLPRYHYHGKEVPVRIRFRKQDRERLADLADFQVPTGTGAVLPVSALTAPRVLDAPKGIFRKDKKVTRSITVELRPDRAKETRQRLEVVQNQLNLPEGMAFGSTAVEQENRDLANMIFAGKLSVLFIYLLMGFLFESFLLPMSILLTIPLASIGVGWIHYLTGKDLDFLGVVGTILLIGVVVNNGIVLVDYINRLRLAGQARTEALLLAAERRFRPIVMTALTTIIGMVPLTFSRPNDLGLSYKSFGLTLIGGMSTATLLTLLVVPVFYTLFDDAREYLMRLWQNRGRGSTPVQVEPPG